MDASLVCVSETGSLRKMSFDCVPLTSRADSGNHTQRELELGTIEADRGKAPKDHRSGMLTQVHASACARTHRF